MCECGRHDLALEGGILGRVDDMVVIRGVNVYPSAVEDIVRSVPGVVEYGVTVINSSALPELKVDVEFATGETPDNHVHELEEAFQRAFSMRVPVNAVPAGTLPRSEGKARRWKRA